MPGPGKDVSARSFATAVRLGDASYALDRLVSQREGIEQVIKDLNIDVRACARAGEGRIAVLMAALQSKERRQQSGWLSAPAPLRVLASSAWLEGLLIGLMESRYGSLDHPTAQPLTDRVGFVQLSEVMRFTDARAEELGAAELLGSYSLDLEAMLTFAKGRAERLMQANASDPALPRELIESEETIDLCAKMYFDGMAIGVCTRHMAEAGQLSPEPDPPGAEM